MKRTLTWFLMILLITSAACATVVDSWDAPNEIWGLTSDGTWLWAGQDDDPTGVAKLMKLDPADGSIVDQYDMPGEELRGIAWDGESIWVYSWRFGSTNVDTIYQVDPSNGTILSTIQTPFSSNNYAGGMTYYDGYLWITRYYPDDPTQIHKVDPATGESVATLTSPHSQPEGITHDASSLWMVGDYFGGAESILYQLDPESGDVLHQEYPLGENVFDTRTYDLTFDGSYFYLVTKRDNNYALRSVYKLQIGGGGNDQPIIDIFGVPYDFGEVIVGDTLRHNFVVNNSGTANLVFTASTEAPFSTADTEYTVEPDSMMQLEISFMPATLGEVEATVTLSSNDPVNPELSFSVSGTGIEAPVPQIEMVPDFLSIEVSAHVVGVVYMDDVEVTNVGEIAVEMSLAAFEMDDETIPEGWAQAGLSSSPLAPGETGDLFISFSEDCIQWMAYNLSEFHGRFILNLEPTGTYQVELPYAGVVVAVEEQTDRPLTYTLSDPYPNPFNAGVRIGYTLPKAGEVKVQVVDILGHRVRTLLEQQAAAGRHEVFWNGMNEINRPVASGTYFIKMQASEFQAIKRVQFVK